MNATIRPLFGMLALSLLVGCGTIEPASKPQAVSTAVQQWEAAPSASVAHFPLVRVALVQRPIAGEMLAKMEVVGRGYDLREAERLGAEVTRVIVTPLNSLVTCSSDNPSVGTIEICWDRSNNLNLLVRETLSPNSIMSSNLFVLPNAAKGSPIRRNATQGDRAVFIEVLRDPKAE